MGRKKMTDENDFARVVEQPSGEHGDLPRPATGLLVECLRKEASGNPKFHGEHWHPCATFTDVHGYGVGCDVCAWNEEKHLFWEAAEQIAQLEQRVIALTQLLSTYGQHLPDCSQNPCLNTAFEFAQGKCTCGFGAALDATKTPHD
jgi:hypothetical protein